MIHTLILPNNKSNNYSIKEVGFNNEGVTYTRIYNRNNFSTKHHPYFETCFICEPQSYNNGTERFNNPSIKFNVKKIKWSSIEWFKEPKNNKDNVTPNININVKSVDEEENTSKFYFNCLEHLNEVSIGTKLVKSKFDELLNLLVKEQNLDVSIRVRLTTVKDILYNFYEEFEDFTKNRHHFKIISKKINFSNDKKDLEELPEFFYNNHSSDGHGVEYWWSKKFK